MSGLAAGIRLAHYDRRVCILERHSAVGGLNSFFGRHGRTYDVGLHAVTNYAPRGTRQGPLARLLRQLRLAWDEFSLSPQVGSAIMFPGATMEFSNDFALLESEVARLFPAEVDNFRRLVAALTDYDQFDGPEAGQSARAVVGSLIGNRAAGRNALLPGALLRRRAGARHGLRPVQHPLPLHLPGGVGPSAGGRAADPEAAAAEILRPGGRTAAASRRGADPGQGRPGRSSRARRRQRVLLPTISSPPPACWRRCGCATGRSPAPGHANELSIVESISSPEPAAASPRPRADHGLLQ